MILGFTGTRQGLTELQQLALTKTMLEARRDRHAYWLHHGDCIGADSQAHWIWRSLNGDVHTHPGVPLGHPHRANCPAARVSPIPTGRTPELDRNRIIVDTCDQLIACPAQSHEILRSGTWATIRYARKMHKPLIIIWPTGLLDTQWWS